MPSASPLFVVGRLPPPYDGQTLATARCADVLDGAFDVRRFDTEPAGGPAARTEPTLDLRRGAQYLGIGRRLRRALAPYPDAPVLWHSVAPTLLGHARDVAVSLPAFGPQRPLVAVLHRALYERLFTRALTAPTARRVARRVTTWVVQSGPLRDALAPHVPPERITIVPNTIDAAVWCSDEEVRAQQGRVGDALGQGPLRVLFLSNMIREQGYRDVLDAVARLHAEGVAVAPHFAGAWPDEATRATFEARVREAGLGDVLVHHGRIADPARIKALHLAADVFVLPTYHPTETQPIALLEAMNAGTPVVTTDREATRAIDGGSGAFTFVPPQAPDAIASALRSLAEARRWHEASEAGRARFQEAFAPDAVAARWREVAAAAFRSGPTPSR